MRTPAAFPALAFRFAAGALIGLLCWYPSPAHAQTGRITGTVKTEEASAVLGATVEAWPAATSAEPSDDDARPPSATTDRDGRFSISDLPHGNYRIAVAAEGYLPHEVAVFPVTPQGGPALVVELAPAVFITGFVTNAKDEVVADAEVTAARPSGPPLLVRTDAKGRFRLGPFARGDKVHIDVLAEGDGAALGWEAVAPRADLRIRMLGAGALRGRVFDSETGVALERFRVEVAGPNGAENRETKRFESPGGHFEWHGLRPGRFAATVSAEGYELHGPAQFTLGQDGENVDLTVAMNKEAVVSGRVIDAATGSPVAGASVTAVTAVTGEWLSYRSLARGNAPMPFGTPSARTDDAGAFTLRQLPRETVTVQVRADDYLAETALAQPGDEHLEIYLSAGATISGWLVHHDGTPTDGTVVLWYPVSMERRTTAATGESGFRFHGMPAGRYRVWGLAAGTTEHWPFEEEQAGVEVSVAPHQDVTDLDVSLGPAAGCELGGVVRGLVGGETARVEVTHFNGKAQRRQGVRPDSAGRYELAVRPGKIRVRALTSAGRVLEREVFAACDDRSGAAARAADFSFDGQAMLFGTVTRQGEPVRGTVLAILSAEDPSPCGSSAAEVAGRTPSDCSKNFGAVAVTSPSGQYAIAGLTNGDYMLAVAGTGHRRKVSVIGDTRVDLRLGEDERRVLFAGTVVAAPGNRPLPGANVSLRSGANKSATPVASRRRTDSNGAFSLTVAPGTYRVFAYKTGFAAVSYRQPILEPTSDVVVALHPASGPTVRLTDAETNRPLPFVGMSIAGEPGGLALHLTSDGTARLWWDLAGRDLYFRHPNYDPVSIRNWDGQALDLKLRARRETGEPSP